MRARGGPSRGALVRGTRRGKWLRGKAEPYPCDPRAVEAAGGRGAESRAPCGLEGLEVLVGLEEGAGREGVEQPERDEQEEQLQTGGTAGSAGRWEDGQ